MPGADIPVPVLVLGGHFENEDFSYIRILKFGIYLDFGLNRFKPGLNPSLNQFKPSDLTGQKGWFKPV